MASVVERGDSVMDMAVGLDLGGTQIRAAVVDTAGVIHARAATKTHAGGGPEAVIQQLVSITLEVTASFEAHQIKGVGVSAPGPLDAKSGMALSVPTLSGFSEVPLASRLSSELQFPVTLENDGIAAALGEWRFGAGRKLQDFVYATISTGIGGGVVADGRLLRGRRGMAAHVGHMTIVANGELCPCGNRGCWEAHASGTAFAKRARTRVHGRMTVLGDHGAAIDGPAIFAAHLIGDPLAGELVDEEADLLGIGITNLLHLFSPAAVVLGGGLSNGFDMLLPGIRRRIEASALPPFREVPVLKAILEGNSGLVGAASLVFNHNTGEASC